MQHVERTPDDNGKTRNTDSPQLAHLQFVPVDCPAADLVFDFLVTCFELHPSRGNPPHPAQPDPSHLHKEHGCPGDPQQTGGCLSPQDILMFRSNA